MTARAPFQSAPRAALDAFPEEAVQWGVGIVAFEIRWSPDARDHLRLLPAYQRAMVIDSVERILPEQPDEPSRKRKLLRENPVATWELRLGDLRVFYDVNRDESAVEVVAVGIKEQHRLRIAGEEIEL
jgi:mRNA-degrading endonuclease RelE of RelBE toxin-antitoxin system